MIRRVISTPLLAALVSVAAVAVACGDAGGSDNAGGMASNPPVVADATATPFRVSFGCTGMTGVDAVIGAVLAHDSETLRSLVDYSSVACSSTVFHGVPPCEQGERDGTLVNAFPIASEFPIYVRPDGIDAFLSSLTSNEMSLYGVYLPSIDFWPPGDFVALFSRNVPGMGAPTEELVISGGRLVGAGDGRDLPPERVVQSGQLGEKILPPP